MTDIHIEKRNQLLLQLKAIRENNRCFYHRPYKWQENLVETVRRKRVTVVPAPNKIGKSASAALIVISWALGFEPWNKSEVEVGGYVKYGDAWYRESSLGIKPPVNIRITGLDWTHHVGKVIVPELKKWSPSNKYTTKKNNVGIEYFWEWFNGSTFEIMTKDQDPLLFEGWLGHGWWDDEPPKKHIYIGMSRGLMLTNGKMLLSMTPLSEAWVLDDLVLSNRDDIGVIGGLSILDNDDLYKYDSDRLKAAGLDDAQIKEYFDILLSFKDTRPFLDAAIGAENTLSLSVPVKMESGEMQYPLKLQGFIKDIPEDERAARIFGKFKTLEGLVLKDFDKDVHVIEPFKIPLDWPVVVQIDLHLNKPHAVGFYAEDKQERRYVIAEIWENMGPEDLADEIVRMKTSNLWPITQVEIDPLSKGDNSYIKNRMGNVEDSFSIIKKRLLKHGITLDVASKDKESGVRNLKNQLKGVNKMASLFFFNTCKKHLFEIQRWVYDDDQKPKKENDDFMECLYRSSLMKILSVKSGSKFKDRYQQAFKRA